jgi:hypothetical protein
MKVLVACEESGRVRDAFIAMGHEAMSCDLQPTAKPGPHFQGDVRDCLDGGWDLLIAHPPCTRLCNSGVRWLHGPPNGKTRDEMWDWMRRDAAFYRLLRDAPIPKRAIENPIMHKHARTLIRPGERLVVQPWWFGDPAFKATGFELIGLPPLVPTNKLVPPAPGTEAHKRWSACLLMSPAADRAKHRSRTYPGIAAAMAEQWGALI